MRTLPAYPFPLMPHYKGTGNINDAQNYAPVTPTTPLQSDFQWIGQGLISP